MTTTLWRCLSIPNKPSHLRSNLDFESSLHCLRQDSFCCACMILVPFSVLVLTDRLNHLLASVPYFKKQIIQLVSDFADWLFLNTNLLKVFYTAFNCIFSTTSMNVDQSILHAYFYQLQIRCPSHQLGRCWSARIKWCYSISMQIIDYIKF